MQRGQIPIKTFFSLIMGFVVLFQYAFAATEFELRQKIEQRNSEIARLEEEISQYREDLQETTTTAQTLKEEVTRLDRQIAHLNKQISLTKARIEKTEFEIESLAGSILNTADALSERQIILAEELRTYNELDEKSSLELYFEYKTLSGFFDALEQNKNITTNIRKQFDELSVLKSMLENQKQSAEKAHVELLRLQNNLLDQRAIENGTKKEKANLLVATKNQEARYQKLLKDREAKRAAIQKEIASIEIELQALINPALLPQKGSRVLGWPIANPVLTQPFGLTDFSKENSDVYKGNGHNGIDLRANVGTPILAAADGIVRGVGNTDTLCQGGSYGKWIVIDHPSSNLSTLYAHASLIKVTTGARISKGDIIGLSGSTGYITGPHLHFTVYATNTFRLAKTVHCGQIPAGGYVNPLDYL